MDPLRQPGQRGLTTVITHRDLMGIALGLLATLGATTEAKALIGRPRGRLASYYVP